MPHPVKQLQKYVKAHPLSAFLLGGLLVVSLVFAKSLVLFLIIAAIAAALNYFIHITHIHLHLGHVSFLAVIFSYSIGFKYGLLMIVIAHFLAEILAGHADTEMVITGSTYVFVSFIAAVFNSYAIVGLGIALTVLQAVITVSLGLVAGTSPFELLTEDGAEFIFLLIYYITFAAPLVAILS